MIQSESLVKIADNTWGKVAQVIRVLKWSTCNSATVWDRVVVAIKDAQKWWQVDKWDVSWAVVVRVRKEIKRNDWTYVRFEDNAVALINKDLTPRGKRIFWPVAKELREKGFRAIANLAEEVI